MDESTHDEQWRPVLGTSGDYEVSDHGRIRSRRVGGLKGQRRVGPWHDIKPKPLYRSNGSLHRYQVGIRYPDGTRKERGVHILVLEAFVGPRPRGMHACHWDDDQDNNRLDNLRWDTPQANETDKLRNGGRRLVEQCKWGHALTPDNVYVRPGATARMCRTCRARWSTENRLRSQAARRVESRP